MIDQLPLLPRTHRSSVSSMPKQRGVDLSDNVRVVGFNTQDAEACFSDVVGFVGDFCDSGQDEGELVSLHGLDQLCLGRFLLQT